MYCRQCGKEYKGKITFCAYCGAKQIIEEEEKLKKDKCKPLKGKRKDVIIPVCLLSVVAIATICIVIINMCAPKRQIKAYADTMIGKQWEESYRYLFAEELKELRKEEYVDFVEELLADVKDYKVKKGSKTQSGYYYTVTFLDSDGQIVLEEQYEVVKKKSRNMLVFSEWELADNMEECEWIEMLIELNHERTWKDGYYDFVKCILDNYNDWDLIIKKYKYLTEELQMFYNGNYSILSGENEDMSSNSPSMLYFKLVYINDDDIPELVMACRDMAMLLRYDERNRQLTPIYWSDEMETTFLVETYNFGLVEFKSQSGQILYGDSNCRMQLYEYDGINMNLMETITYKVENYELPSKVQEYNESVTQFGQYLWCLTEDNINTTLKYDFLDSDVRLKYGEIKMEEKKEKELIDIGVMYRELNRSYTYGGKALVREQIDMRYHLQFKDLWLEEASYGYYEGVEVWSEQDETSIRYANEYLDGIVLFGLYPGMDATNIEEILSGYGFTYSEEYELYRDGESFNDTAISVEIEDGTIQSIYMYFIQ